MRKHLGPLLVPLLGLAVGACSKSPRREPRAGKEEPSTRAGYRVTCSSIGIGDSLARVLPDSECRAFGALADSFRKVRQVSAYVSSYSRGRLVLLDAHPLRDVMHTTRINAVVAAGRLLQRSDLDRLLDEAARSVMRTLQPRR